MTELPGFLLLRLPSFYYVRRLCKSQNQIGLRTPIGNGSDCVFITSDNLGTAFWYVTRHEPERLFVEMLKIVPGLTACRLNIQLFEDGAGCLADATYIHTSLGPTGDEFVAKFTTDYYQKFVQVWEEALNHFLTTGRLLPDDPAA